MFKKLIILLFLLSFFSCSDNEKAIVVDSAFHQFYSLGNKKFDGVDIIVSDPLDSEELNLSQYKGLIVSPVIYDFKQESLKKFTGELWLFNYRKKISNKEHKKIIIDFSSVLAALSLEYEGREDVKLGVISDYSLKDQDKFWEREFYINSSIKDNKKRIQSFIKRNRSINTWIVISDIYPLYVYEQIDSEDSVILLHGEDLMSYKDNIVKSIDSGFFETVNCFGKEVFSVEARLKSVETIEVSDDK